MSLLAFQSVAGKKPDIVPLAEIPGGGALAKFLVGLFRWESEALTLYQATFSSIMEPYSRLDAKDPYRIPD